MHPKTDAYCRTLLPPKHYTIVSHSSGATTLNGLRAESTEAGVKSERKGHSKTKAENTQSETEKK